MAQWYTMSAEDVVDRLGTDSGQGLTRAEADGRLQKNGYNELTAKKGPTLWTAVFNQFKDFLVLILIASGTVSILVGEIADAAVIFVIVILNAVLGASQERQADKALEALKKMASPQAAVIRDGKIIEVPSRELVQGDLVSIETGDFIPADLRLTESINLKVDESSITGESVAVEKDAEGILGEDAGTGDRSNLAFMGTVVTYGRGKGIVTETGMNTMIGNIAGMLETYSEGDTPLQKRLASFGKLLGIISVIVIAVVFVIGLIRNIPLLEMFMTSVSLAVAAIPEGLPAIVTIVLALGMKKMIRRHAIVKRLHAVETLGSVTVICSDKTGTLTRNEMTVTVLHTGGRTIDVSGNGYAPEGEFSEDGSRIDPHAAGELDLLLRSCMLNNDSKLENDQTGAWKIIGDPTEGALITLSRKAGFDPGTTAANYPRLREIPFDSDRKMMTTYHGTKERPDAFIAVTKGAPDVILSRCTKIFSGDTIRDFTDEDRELVSSVNSRLSQQAIRVLAFAFRELGELPDKPGPGTDETDLILLGLVGMIDPARSEAATAVATAKRAGIRSVMITGDYKETAMAIARQIGIMEEDDRALSGAELDKTDDEELAREVRSVSVFARVSPEHKVRIVDALKKNGQIVSMTGDGVNDAPSLKRADIGVAMGITGTDVARETADIILTDDNFASIVSAVEEGRTIYGNIRKFIFFLLSCNLAEILIIFLAMIIGLPIPLKPIQILWLNLITDAFPALALGLERAEPGIMNRPPRNPSEPIIDWKMRTGIIVQSILLSGAVLGIFIFILRSTGSTEAARNYAFTTLILAELLRAFTARSESQSLFTMGFFRNPYIIGGTLLSFVLLLVVLYVPFLQSIFETFPPHAVGWLTVTGFAFIPFVGAEVTKIFIRRREERLVRREKTA